MVKLQKQFAYRYKDKEHYKHIVTIPESTIAEVGWTEGQDLNWAINGKILVLQPNETKGKDDKQ